MNREAARNQRVEISEVAPGRLAVKGETAVLPAREVRRDWVYSRDVGAGLAALLDAGRTTHALFHLSSGRDCRRAGVSATCSMRWIRSSSSSGAWRRT